MSAAGAASIASQDCRFRLLVLLEVAFKGVPPYPLGAPRAACPHRSIANFLIAKAKGVL